MQNFEIVNQRIKTQFEELLRANPSLKDSQLHFSWSNWGFGLESLEDSLKRLAANQIPYIELHGNHYGPDLGYRASETKQLLERYHIQVSGVCGMFSRDNDLSSNRAVERQRAIDYIKREVEFTAEVGGSYLLVVPGAVGRPNAYDQSEWERSVEALCLVADFFTQYHVRAAIEPIRSAEVSLVHTVKDAKKYIAAVNHPGVAHINGDVYHMQSEESHIGGAILEAGDALVNLHLADSNRCALGDGFMDLDTIIMALYLIGYQAPGHFVTPEPLGPGGDPYPAMNNIPNPAALDELVKKSVDYFRAREKELLSK